MQPLQGIQVVEFAGQAPGPFAALVLADLGASVVRIDRTDQGHASTDVLHRGKRSIALDLKSPEGLSVVKRLLRKADVVIDPFRPGVLEKMGLGFSQSGDQKDMAGHDLNYLSSSGLLSMMPPMAPDNTPSFPSNLFADFAGGGLMLALKILAALHERSRTGRGQLISHDMVNGARYAGSFLLLNDAWPDTPYFGRLGGQNLFDGGAPWTNTYRCGDGGFVAVAPLETKFYALFLELFLSALPSNFKDDPRSKYDQNDREHWYLLKQFFKEGFLTNTRDEWAALFHGTDACVTPVLTPSEAASKLPSPIPTLFSDSPIPARGSHTLNKGQHTLEILEELKISKPEKAAVLRAAPTKSRL